MQTSNEVLEEWNLRVSTTKRAHYLSCRTFWKPKKLAWNPRGCFGNIGRNFRVRNTSKTIGPWLQILIGLASVAAAILSSLQTFLGYSERAEKHRLAGAKYGALGRELESLRENSDGVSNEQMDRVR